MRIAITGAAGRMGRNLIEATHEMEGVSLGAAIVRPGSSLIGADAGEMAGVGPLGVKIVDSLQAACDHFDVLIDFTLPEVTAENLAFCRANGKKIVIGTTGLSDEQKAALHAAASDIAIVFAPNMSVGVNLTLKLLQMAAKVLG
ncbi:MAG: 4-hydroxy-tetrahydrodipicolinate reductase, partial [Chromatiales bacterium]|nr:4-hydroxy-tetrahydrodipicolinate reductase [Chromatiales bacterium]